MPRYHYHYSYCAMLLLAPIQVFRYLNEICLTDAEIPFAHGTPFLCNSQGISRGAGHTGFPLCIKSGSQPSSSLLA